MTKKEKEIRSDIFERIPPRRLPPDALDALGLRYAAGDPSVREDLLSAVIALIAGLAFGLADSRRELRPHVDDMIAEGIGALYEYAPHYDGSSRFSTYIRGCCRGVILQFGRRHRSAIGSSAPSRACDFDGAAFRAPARNRMALDVADDEDEEEPATALEARARLAAVLARLEPREKQVVLWRWGIGTAGRVYQMDEIADLLGVSFQRVQQIERRAMRKLGCEIAVSPRAPRDPEARVMPSVTVRRALARA